MGLCRGGRCVGCGRGVRSVQLNRPGSDEGLVAETHREFCDYIEAELRRAATSAVNRERRVRRIHLATNSLDEQPRHASETEFQTLMTSTIANVFEFTKLTKTINPELDSFAYCAWFQGVLPGQLLIEPTQPDVERWLTIATPAALAPLRLPTPSEPTPDR